MRLPERSPDGNLFRVPRTPPNEEVFEQVAGGEDVRVERIVSTGQASPAGQWYAQHRDEWVVLLQGEAQLAYDDGSRLLLASLCARPESADARIPAARKPWGDYVLIPAGERHRVEWTREDPPCIWLAVHADGLAPR